MPTPSGYGTVRSVEVAVVRQKLRDVLSVGPDGGRVVHCCAADVPLRLLRDAGADALAVDAALLTSAQNDELGEAVDAGLSLWLGVLPGTDADDHARHRPRCGAAALVRAGLRAGAGGRRGRPDAGVRAGRRQPGLRAPRARAAARYRQGICSTLDIFPYGNMFENVARAATTTDAFNAIAEPRRRQILDLLAAGELPVNDLVAQLGLAQPQVSKHLRVLREVGLVDVRDEGRQRMYRLNGGPLKPIADWLATLRADLDRTLRPHGCRAGRTETEGARRWT